MNVLPEYSGSTNIGEIVAPIIYFIYSHPYDTLTRKASKGNKWPDREQLKQRTAGLEALWQESGPQILQIIQEVIGMPWQYPEYKCYVVSAPVAYADPLTVGYRIGSLHTAFDVLVHELLHVYILEYNRHYPKKLKAALRRYESEPGNTRSHIPIDALQQYIYKQLGWLDRIPLIRKRHNTDPHYMRAWEVVDRDSVDQIIKSLVI